MADDPLRLVFLCCHPALSPEAQVALTLRLVCGLPTPAELPERLDAVRTTIHLLFTTGHTAPSGESLMRVSCAERALELARLLRELVPDSREVRGLLALLPMGHARQATRTDGTGRLLLLSEQDRSRWDRAALAEADELVVSALRGGPPGRFALQVAIAMPHASAPSYEETDWPQILVLYDELAKVWPSPVVALNRTVAVAMVDGPAQALAEVTELEADPRLSGYHYLPAIKADLLRRSGRFAEAAGCYEEALRLTDNEVERAFLAERLAEMRETGSVG